MDLVSKKVPRSLDARLKRLQARYQLKHRRRMSEARIIDVAVRHLEEHDVLESVEAPKMNKAKKLTDLIGIIKGGPRTNATEELDDVVYSDVDKT